MKKFGLIGYPISHSLSPTLFKAAYNGKYPYELIEDENFDTAYGKFIKDYDDDYVYGYIGRPDRAMFKDFKRIVRECVEDRRVMRIS